MNLFFCSCIPRSGSTLLLNFLAQNPAIHVTPTNDLADMVVKVRDSWMTQDAFKAQGLKLVAPRIRKMMWGMLRNFFPELSTRTVIDKSRTWIGYIDLLEEILEEKVKIIVPVRASEDVLASFEKIHRKSALTTPTHVGPLHAIRQTVIGRAQSYLAPEAHLGMMIARLRDALVRHRDRLLIVPYRDLTNEPLRVADWITEEIGLPWFCYDHHAVRQVTVEDDTVYGMDLHQIREGKIEPAERNPWHRVLPEDFVQWVQREYADINELAIPKRWEKVNGLQTAHR